MENPVVETTSMVDWGRLAPEEPDASAVTTGQVVEPWE